MPSDLEMLNSSEDNLVWFQDNSDIIKENYPPKIIAILDRKIVAVADNVDELRKKLNEERINESLVLIEIISKPNEIVVL